MLDTRIPDGLKDIRERWTLDDVCHAHDFLDELDQLAARQRARERETAAQARQQGARR